MSWLTTSIDNIVLKINKEVHSPWVFTAGCCTPEIESLSKPIFDWQRLGVDDSALDPRHANLLLIAGWINESRSIELKRIYNEMEKPTLVLAIGACSISGSPYDLGDGSKIIRAEDVVPVDLFVPGCPPRPESILLGILELKKKYSRVRSHDEILQSALR